MVTCEEWKKEHSLIELYNDSVLALRKYQSHTMTESSLLTAPHQWDENHSNFSIQCGSLSLPIYEINVISLIGDLPGNEMEGKSIRIQTSGIGNEIHEMIDKLFPSCEYQSERVGKECNGITV